MGGCSSGHKNYWDANKDIFVDEIDFHRHEINRFHDKFLNCDIRNTGDIRPDEFYAYFKLEPTDPLSEKLFHSLDVKGNGRLDFCQFVCTLWNFLSLPTKQLGAYAHFMYDENKTGKLLMIDQVKVMIEELTKQKCEGKSKAKKILDNFVKQKFEFSIVNFTEWTQSNTSFLSNLIGFHEKLQLQVLGKEFWAILSKKRYENQKLGHPLYIYKVLAQRYDELEIARLKTLQKNTKKKAENEVKTASISADSKVHADDEPDNPGLEQAQDEENEIVVVEGSKDIEDLESGRGGLLSRGGITLPSLQTGNETNTKKKKKKRRKKKKKVVDEVADEEEREEDKEVDLEISEEEQKKIDEAIQEKQKLKERRKAKRLKLEKEKQEKELAEKKARSAVKKVAFIAPLHKRQAASMGAVERAHMRKMAERENAVEVEKKVSKGCSNNDDALDEEADGDAKVETTDVSEDPNADGKSEIHNDDVDGS